MPATEKLREAILAQNPTQEQRDAIFAEELEFLLRASPGSGKTWTSCRRFIWRAANWPYHVGGLALLSFTNAAIREFKTATTKIGRGDLLSDPNFVGTFDSFVERYILSPFGHLIADGDRRPRLFTGPRPGDRNNTKLKRWGSSKAGKKHPVYAWDIIPVVDNAGVQFRTSSKYGSQTVDGASSAVSELMRLGYYTHSQRVFWACTLLRERPHIAGVLARRFPEIIVDEAQDSNAWLLVLLNYVRDEGSRITLIGDPDQCIFEFSMADATSLPTLKEQWAIPEKPLSQSFRCNNQIAAAVRNIGGKADFIGCGDGKTSHQTAFVVQESSDDFSDSVDAFQRLAKLAGVSLEDSAVICRGHSQLEAIRGEAHYSKLQGKAKNLAKAAFLRDMQHDYHRASSTVENVLRELTGDDPTWEQVDSDAASPERMAMTLAIWRFVKNPTQLPPITTLGNEWIEAVRVSIDTLIKEMGLGCSAKLGNHINAKGLPPERKLLPLFESLDDFPVIRQDTIHQVKGESIDAVLVTGNTRFWNTVVKAVEESSSVEERRLAYVAMTRARHLLVVALPESHFTKHATAWKTWGFKLAQSELESAVEGSDTGAASPPSGGAV